MPAFWKIAKAASICARILPNAVFRVAWRISDLLDNRLGAATRYVLIASRLRECGENVYFGPFIWVDFPEHLTVGSNVSVHQGVSFLAAGGIELGDNVAIAHGSSLISGEHTWNDDGLAIKYNPVELAPVLVADDVWIGCGAKILAGVEIRSRSVIAAGAVVTKSCNESGIYGGVPARLIKRI